MKFWRNNRTDQEFDMPIGELVAAYYATEWPRVDMMLERKVGLFLSLPDGPVCGVWEEADPDFDKLLDAIIEARP